MFKYFRTANFKKILQWIFISALCGILAGLAASVFLILLNAATQFRQAHPHIILFLPLAGLFIGWIYYQYGKDIAAGNNLVLDEIHNPKKTIPFAMAPFILLGTLITHLFGGSAGREGTAVQMGATLSDQLAGPFKLSRDDRKILLVAGAGAGFGAAIGAPWAGVIFGMEVIYVGRLKLTHLCECLIASWVAYAVTLLLHAPHSRYPEINLPSFSLETLISVIIAGILFGVTARLFIKFTHTVEKLQTRFIPYPPLKPFLGGILLLILFYLEGTYRFTGLGIEVIQQALQVPATFLEPLWKGLLTAITLGSGFKGGEFIPLVFMGTTLGSALSIFVPATLGLLGALGFAAVFAGAANTPLACTLMAAEIFGPRIVPYALLACYLSYYFSGQRGIYAQPHHLPKKHHKVTRYFRSQLRK